MNTKILGLRTTLYKVDNLTEAKAWYSQAFQTRPHFDEPYYIGYNIGGYELGLKREETVKGENVVTFWGVDNIEETYNYFLECGAREVEKPTNVGEDIMIATVRDPWNNVIGLIYNPHFKV